MNARLPRGDVGLEVAVLDGHVEVALGYLGHARWSVTVNGRYAGIVREWGNGYQARCPGDESIGGADREDWTVALHLLLMEADIAVAVSARAVFR